MPKPNLIALGDAQPAEKIQHDVVIFDATTERAVVNLVPNRVREAIESVVQDYPQYLEASEVNLYEILKPTELDDRLRLSFWKEYNRAQDNGIGMKMANVYSPIMSMENFYHKVLKNPDRVAWMIKPPEEYMISLEASLNHGKNNLDKIMKMNLFDEQGNLKKNEASIFLKAYELLDNRVKGAVIQRIEQKTASLHVHQKVDQEELRKELDELRDKQAALDVGVVDGVSVSEER